jgi:hypothetical protein
MAGIKVGAMARPRARDFDSGPRLREHPWRRLGSGPRSPVGDQPAAGPVPEASPREFRGYPRYSRDLAVPPGPPASTPTTMAYKFGSRLETDRGRHPPRSSRPRRPPVVPYLAGRATLDRDGRVLGWPPITHTALFPHRARAMGLPARHSAPSSRDDDRTEAGGPGEVEVVGPPIVGSSPARPAGGPGSLRVAAAGGRKPVHFAGYSQAGTRPARSRPAPAGPASRVRTMKIRAHRLAGSPPARPLRRFDPPFSGAPSTRRSCSAQGASGATPGNAAVGRCARRPSASLAAGGESGEMVARLNNLGANFPACCGRARAGRLRALEGDRESHQPG